MAQFEFVGFFGSLGPVMVDGDRATGTCYQQEILDQKDGTTRTVIGRYRDEFIKEEEQWRFSTRRYEILRARHVHCRRRRLSCGGCRILRWEGVGRVCPIEDPFRVRKILRQEGSED